MTVDKLVQAVNELKEASKNLEDVLSEIEGHEELKKNVSMFCLGELENNMLNTVTNTLVQELVKSTKQTV